jgi:Rod binding domain-containing protein
MANPIHQVTPNLTEGRGTPRLQQPGPLDPKAAQLHNLRKGAGEFETLFPSHLLKTMPTTIHKAEPAKSLGGEIMLDVASEKVADGLAKKGGIGLDDMIYETTKRRVVADTSGAVANDRPIPRETGRQFRPLGHGPPVNK